MPQSRRKWRRGMWGTDCMMDHQATLPLRQPKLDRGKSRPSPSLLYRQPLDGINDNMAVGAGVGDFYTALSVCDFEIAEREPQSIHRRSFALIHRNCLSADLHRHIARTIRKGGVGKDRKSVV